MAISRRRVLGSIAATLALPAAASAQPRKSPSEGRNDISSMRGAGGRSSQRAKAATAKENKDSLLQDLLRHERVANRRVLIRGGHLLSMDPAVGNFETADVLIEGDKIIEVGPQIEAEAVTIDATDRIIIPGFVDTHHHQYETVLRSILSDGQLAPSPEMTDSYTSLIQAKMTPAYLPEDLYISEYVASLNQISAGVTTTIDTSQAGHSPEHTDAMIRGLTEAGHRAVFAYSPGIQGPALKYPADIVRLRKQYFSSDSQLLTLAMGASLEPTEWAVARSVGAPIITHVVGSFGKFGREGLAAMAAQNLMGPDCVYIHCTDLNDDLWRRIADSGGKVSIAPAIEMQMGHGMPPIQLALDHKLDLGLSVDVECSMAADMFTVMRTAFILQRALLKSQPDHDASVSRHFMTCYEAVRIATLGGAKVANLERKIGSVTPGKQADLVLLDTDRVNIFPLNNVPGAIVTLMDTSNVDTVFIAGKVRKWDGALVRINLQNIRSKVEHSRDRLLERTAYSKKLFESCCYRERI